uniref:VIT domain-containing protein n=1 Tax=Paramormyrops kingsleyae TaxID=1676925 RepID=A0A3B3S9C4_9TELE
MVLDTSYPIRAVLPLKSVEVQVDVQGHVASVSSTLQYENQESSPVEAVFIFPMESNATIYSFVYLYVCPCLLIVCQAQEEYDDAVSSGQQAFLLEESDESSDVFRLSVGSLPPGQSASVTLSYVTELAVQADDALRFSRLLVFVFEGWSLCSKVLATQKSPEMCVCVCVCFLTVPRCFTFGIGEGASSALVNGMAEGGSGHPQFITGAERLQPKVMQSLQFALQPVVEDISVKWNIPADISVTPLSPLPNVIFQNQRAILYFQLAGQSSSNISGSVSLHYTLHKKAVENTLTLNMKPKEDSSMLIHRLGARKAILTLEGERGEAGDKTGKERAVELSIQSGVSSSYTAFIAVNTENKQPIKGPLLRRNIRKLHDSARVCLPSPPKSCKPRGNTVYTIVKENVQEQYCIYCICLQYWALLMLHDCPAKVKEEYPFCLIMLPVWATVLAVLWLHGHKMDFKDEWQFVAAKAVAWIKAQSGSLLATGIEPGTFAV